MKTVQFEISGSLKTASAKKGTGMKSPDELHHELRQRILKLPGVTEQSNAGVHEDAFFVGRTMFMHIHGHGHCDIRLSKLTLLAAPDEPAAPPAFQTTEASGCSGPAKTNDDFCWNGGA